MTKRTGRKCVAVQIKWDVEKRIGVVDPTVDRLRHRQVRLGSHATKMVRRANVERMVKEFNGMLEIRLSCVLSVTRESSVTLVCHIFQLVLPVCHRLWIHND